MDDELENDDEDGDEDLENDSESESDESEYEPESELPSLPSINDERSRDAARKRASRSENARIEIPPCKNPERRAACLEDPELFLKTYFAARFYNPFVSHHKHMIQAIVACARDGGDQAIAAPRGDGKSQIAIHMLAYVILKGYCRFPVFVQCTRKLAEKSFKQFKGFWEKNHLLAEDFPEICWPVKCLNGAAQRAAQQHVDGINTEIAWTADSVRFPKVPSSPYGGIAVMYFGLDSAIRGVNDEGERPTFVLIDDPETPDVAANDEQNNKVEVMIDSDIAGLGAPDKPLARMVLTTIQNSHCYSARVTNPRIKPSWDGKRYAMLEVWPDCWTADESTGHKQHWHEYIKLRQKDQSSGDRYGRSATAYYLANQEAMDAGAVISNPYRFLSNLTPDGYPIEHTALQAFFNRVADWGIDRVLSELQNDPTDEEEIQTVGLTAGLIATRLSGFQQREIPPSAIACTVGLDLGDRVCHWVKCAWWGRAIGCIVDYGIMETSGLAIRAETEAIQHALLNAFPGWRTDLLAAECEHAPLFLSLVDSGDGQHSDAVYKFCREAGSPFFPSKGWDTGRFRIGRDQADGTRQTFLEAYAAVQNQKRADAFWMYHINTEYWKQWAHERFLTKTFDASQLHNDGSLSLFSPPKGKENSRLHFSFSQHIVAEERRTRFLPGRGPKVEWYQRNRNNHYLDALALACAAAGCIGISLVGQPGKGDSDDDEPQGQEFRRPSPEPNRTGSQSSRSYVSQESRRFETPHGQAFLVTDR